MPDGSTFPRAPAEAIKRLQRAEQRQRNNTRKRGLPAEPVCVEGLLLIQRNRCAWHQYHCGAERDDGTWTDCAISDAEALAHDAGFEIQRSHSAEAIRAAIPAVVDKRIRAALGESK